MKLITLTMAQIYLCPMKPYQRAIMHNGRALTGKTKGDAAIINVINYACAFPAMTCQNVGYEKSLFCFQALKRGHCGLK